MKSYEINCEFNKKKKFDSLYQLKILQNIDYLVMV